MNPSRDQAQALLRKAREDRYVLERLVPDENAPVWTIGFHAQQAVEKALKAVLCAQGIEYPRTHNLTMLLELLRREGLSLPPRADAIGRLTPYGVVLRYDLTEETDMTLDRESTAACVATVISWAQSRVADESA